MRSALISSEMLSGASRPARHVRRDSLYFAFGSNLQLAQMAKRCPESRYIGRAQLRGYKWFINQRGFANIVPSQNDSVLGLCYLLNAKDESRLDINEGVATGAYEKEFLLVELFVGEANLVGRKVSEILDSALLAGGSHKRKRKAVHLGSNQDNSGAEVKGESILALVYASRQYTDKGFIRAEYADRMNLGFADALALGVSEEYVQSCVKRCIQDESIRKETGDGPIKDGKQRDWFAMAERGTRQRSETRKLEGSGLSQRTRSLSASTIRPRDLTGSTGTERRFWDREDDGAQIVVVESRGHQIRKLERKREREE